MSTTYTLPGSNPLTDETRGMITRKADGELEAPDSIIMTANAAKALYSTIRTNGLKRIALWAAIEGLIAGNPPYDQDELDANGLSHMTNYNDLSARSRFEKECLAYFNLINQAERICKFVINFDDPEASKWADILSIKFNKVIRKWKSFNTMLGTHSAQLSKLGLSVLLWPDERDWRPRVTELHRFSVPDQTYCDLDQMTFCFFENDFTAQKLFEVYNYLSKKQTKEQREDGEYYKDFWNLKALSEILLFRANAVAKANNYQFVDLYDLQVRLQNGDYTYSTLFGDGIRLVSLLYKEYSGKISHYMFDTIWAENRFLFRADEQYHDFSQACAIFTVSPGEFTLHSNRGIGHKVFAPCQAKNQLACSLVDMARYSATPMLRNNSGSVADPQQIKMYPGVPTDIGAAEFVQNNLGNNIQQVVGALNFLEQNLSMNLGMSGDDPSMPDSSVGSVSPTQARFQSYREFNLLKNHVAHFYAQMDAVYANIVSIMLRSKEGFPGYSFVKEWKESCVRAGVPEIVFEVPSEVEWGLPDHLEVKATRVAGDGSTVGLIMGLQEMQPILSSLSPKATRAYVQDMVLATMGADAIPRYTQDMDDPDEVSGGASLAGLENNNMAQGFSPVFSPSNEHKAHFAIHMALGIDTMQKVQQQQSDPIQAQKVFDHLVPHLQEHWAVISKSIFNEEFVRKYKKPFDQLIQYAVLNKKNAIKMYEAQIKEQQEQQAQQAQVLDDIQLKNLQAQADIARKDKVADAKIAQQDKESQTRAELKKEDIQRNAENKRLQIQLDHGVNVQKTTNENSLEQNRLELQKLTQIEVPSET